MKDLVRLPAVFLLAFLLLFVLTLTLALLSAWGSLLPVDRAMRALALAPALARLPGLARQVLPVSVLAALLMVLMRVARKPRSRLLSVVLPPACAVLLLVLGFQALGALAAIWPKAEGEAGSPTAYLTPGVFTPSGREVLYVQAVEAGRASGIVVFGEAGRSGRLSHAPRGELQVRRDTVTLRLEQRQLQWPARSVHAPLFAPDPLVGPFLADLRLLDQELSRQQAEARGMFYLSCLGLVAAVSGAGVLLRLTRWPLLNACLALLAARGVLALFVLLRPDGATRLGKALGGAGIAQSLPGVGLLVLGVVLVLVDLLFVPFDRREEDPYHA